LPAPTRIGDMTEGTCNIGQKCCPHARSGTNLRGSPNVIIEGLSAHRVDDTGATNCPHGGQFVSLIGSSSVFINGKQVTREGDTTVCASCGLSGVHVSGATSVFIGG
jgi:uncharacterized Zn-binding protein involved in type VI secretion